MNGGPDNKEDSEDKQQRLKEVEVKALLISFVAGLLVGVAYGVIRVKSPAPPIIALVGLLGMVLGEQ